MFRFSFAELRRLANVLQLPEIIETDQIDKVCRVEALSMIYQTGEPQRSSYKLPRKYLIPKVSDPDASSI